jgi:predicted small secreted protein
MIFELDLDEEQLISEVSANFLQSTGSWILMPKEVIFEILSSDKKVLHKETVFPEATLEVKGTIVETLKTQCNVNGRYVKVHAASYKTLPSWYKGAGNKCWLFVDEVIVK